MTKKDELNRIKEIEIQQLLLLPEVEALRSVVNNNPKDAIASEILEEKIDELGTLRKEKALLLLNLGFQITGISIDETFVDTEMWKQIDLAVAPLETSNLRYSLCTNCPEFVTISKQCKPLGVFAEEYSLIESSSCPIGKW
jgi:hypothetical protein